MKYFINFDFHKQFYTNFSPHNIIIIILLLVQSVLFIPSVHSVVLNNEPLNVGFIFSLPYDISNTLRAPLAGPLSLILTAGLALVMFFGLLISPVSYIFGYPSRNYYIHDAVKDPVWNSWDVTERKKRQIQEFDEQHKYLHDVFDNDKINLNNNKSENVNIGSNKFKSTASSNNSNNKNTVVPPSFQQSIFTFIPNQDRACQLLLICHAHGFLSFIPLDILRVYQFMSKRIIGVGDEQKNAILIGLQDQSQCSKIYNKCTNDITTITRTTFKYILSEFMQVEDN